MQHQKIFYYSGSDAGLFINETAILPNKLNYMRLMIPYNISNDVM